MIICLYVYSALGFEVAVGVAAHLDGLLVDGAGGAVHALGHVLGHVLPGVQLEQRGHLDAQVVQLLLGHVEVAGMHAALQRDAHAAVIGHGEAVGLKLGLGNGGEVRRGAATALQHLAVGLHAGGVLQLEAGEALDRRGDGVVALARRDGHIDVVRPQHDLLRRPLGVGRELAQIACLLRVVAEDADLADLLVGEAAQVVVGDGVVDGMEARVLAHVPVAGALAGDGGLGGAHAFELDGERDVHIGVVQLRDGGLVLQVHPVVERLGVGHRHLGAVAVGGVARGIGDRGPGVVVHVAVAHVGVGLQVRARHRERGALAHGVVAELLRGLLDLIRRAVVDGGVVLPVGRAGTAGVQLALLLQEQAGVQGLVVRVVPVVDGGAAGPVGEGAVAVHAGGESLVRAVDEQPRRRPAVAEGGGVAHAVVPVGLARGGDRELAGSVGGISLAVVRARHRHEGVAAPTGVVVGVAVGIPRVVARAPRGLERVVLEVDLVQVAVVDGVLRRVLINGAGEVRRRVGRVGAGDGGHRGLGVVAAGRRVGRRRAVLRFHQAHEGHGLGGAGARGDLVQGHIPRRVPQIVEVQGRLRASGAPDGGVGRHLDDALFPVGLVEGEIHRGQGAHGLQRRAHFQRLRLEAAHHAAVAVEVVGVQIGGVPVVGLGIAGLQHALRLHGNALDAHGERRPIGAGAAGVAQGEDVAGVVGLVGHGHGGGVARTQRAVGGRVGVAAGHVLRCRGRNRAAGTGVAALERCGLGGAGVLVDVERLGGGAVDVAVEARQREVVHRRGHTVVVVIVDLRARGGGRRAVGAHVAVDAGHKRGVRAALGGIQAVVGIGLVQLGGHGGVHEADVAHGLVVEVAAGVLAQLHAAAVGLELLQTRLGEIERERRLVHGVVGAAREVDVAVGVAHELVDGGGIERHRGHRVLAGGFHAARVHGHHIACGAVHGGGGGHLAGGVLGVGLLGVRHRRLAVVDPQRRDVAGAVVPGGVRLGGVGRQLRAAVVAVLVAEVAVDLQRIGDEAAGLADEAVGIVLAHAVAVHGGLHVGDAVDGQIQVAVLGGGLALVGEDVLVPGVLARVAVAEHRGAVHLAARQRLALVELGEAALAPTVGHVGDRLGQRLVDDLVRALRAMRRRIHLVVVLVRLAAGPVEVGLQLRLGGERHHLREVAVDGARRGVAVPRLGLVLGGELGVQGHGGGTGGHAEDLDHGAVALGRVGLGHLGGEVRQVQHEAHDVQIVGAAHVGLGIVADAVLMLAAVGVHVPGGLGNGDDPLAGIVLGYVVGQVDGVVLGVARGIGVHLLAVLIGRRRVGRAAHLVDRLRGHIGHGDGLVGVGAVALDAAHGLGAREGGVVGADGVHVQRVAFQGRLHLVLGQHTGILGRRMNVVALLLEAEAALVQAVAAGLLRHGVGEDGVHGVGVQVDGVHLEAAPLAVDQLAVDGGLVAHGARGGVGELAAVVVVGAVHIGARGALVAIVHSAVVAADGDAGRIHGVARVVREREAPAGVHGAHEGLHGAVVVGIMVQHGARRGVLVEAVVLFVHLLARLIGVQEGDGADLRLHGIDLRHEHGGVGAVHAVGAGLSGTVQVLVGERVVPVLIGGLGLQDGAAVDVAGPVAVGVGGMVPRAGMDGVRQMVVAVGQVRVVAGVERGGQRDVALGGIGAAEHVDRRIVRFLDGLVEMVHVHAEHGEVAVGPHRGGNDEIALGSVGGTGGKQLL